MRKTPAAHAAPVVPQCSLTETPKAGVGAVIVRSKASTSGAALGQVNQGQTIKTTACGVLDGGAYTACGTTSTSWLAVTWQGAAGFIAAICVRGA